MSTLYSKHAEELSNPVLKASRVLIVCHDRYLSGANRALLDWLAERDRNRALITILLPRNNEESRAQFTALGCVVWSAPYVLSVKSLYKQGPKKTLKELIKHAWALLAHPLLARIIAKRALVKGIEVVHSNSFATTFGAEVAEAMGVPHIWHIREFCEADHGFTHYNPALLETQCSCSHAIFISDVVRDYQVKRHLFRSGTVIYDLVRFDSAIVISRSFMEDGVCNVVIVGAIAEGKGQLEAIRAVKILRSEGRSVRLYLCGQGDRERLRTEIAGCGDFIIDLGYRDDVNRIRTRMDIALVCSRMEAFGRVTVEAQYYGNVVIGADAGCTPHLIENGRTGFLYEKGDSEDLARKIEFCMDNPKLMPQITATARTTAISRCANGISNLIFSVYERALTEKAVGSNNDSPNKQGDIN